jgi:hypothetical protein
MTVHWREYCILCDELGEYYAPGNPIPEPKQHSCGRMLVLVAGTIVRTADVKDVSDKLKKNARNN